MKLSELMAVPLAVTVIEPEAAFVGTVAVIWVAESTLKLALTPLNVTVEVEVKFVPVMMTLSPTAPLVGEKPEMTGGGLVWPSTLLRSTAATLVGRAVKNV